MSVIILSPGKRGTIRLEYQVDSKTQFRESSEFVKSADVRKAVNGISNPAVTSAVFNGLLDAYNAVSPPEALRHVLLDSSPASHVRLRGIYATEAIEYPTFRDCIAAHPEVNEPRIEWDDIQSLCSVDVDSAKIDLDVILSVVQPAPAFAWNTKSGGLRLIYEAISPYTAEELAAVACIIINDWYPMCRIELKRDTRHPAYAVKGKSCSPVRCLPNNDMSALARFFGTSAVSEEEINDYLSSHELSVGQRYSHTRCPVAPDQKGNPSVQVHATHIYCYHCAANGRRIGGRKPGYFPFTALLGVNVSNIFTSLVTNLTHWTHARTVIKDRLVYSAALKQRHGNDLRIPSVFAAGTNLLRYYGYWATAAGEPLAASKPGFSNILKRLPALQYIDDGKVCVNDERIGYFTQSTDLSTYGYPAITTVWGCRIWGERLEYKANKMHVVQHKVKQESRQPRYQQGDEEAAWGVLEEYFPGVNRNLVKLLLCAKGCMEGESGVYPMLFIEGPTGAGKTVSVNLAAGIAGDGVKCVTWSTSQDRVRQHLLEAKEQGSYASFDEFVKQSEGKEGGSVRAMEMLLTFAPDSLSHKLYIGSVPLGTPPVCVWCDTKIPPEIASHGQIARRLVAVTLSRSHREWESAIPCNPVDIRLQSDEVAEACNIILTSVIDDYFSAPIIFKDCAIRLGFSQLEDGEAIRESEDDVRELYSLVSSMPDAPDKTGWKLIPPDEANRVRALYNTVTLRRIQEMDLTAILGTPCTFHKREVGRKLYVQFRLCTEDASVHGRGNAIHSEPEVSGFPSLLDLPNYTLD